MTALPAAPPAADDCRSLDALIGPIPIRDTAARAVALSHFTRDAAVIAEVLAAAQPVVPERVSLPAVGWEDERCVTAWAQYATEATAEGAVPVLRRALLQLQFPIAAAIAQDEAYLAATRRGIKPTEMLGPEFCDPAGIEIALTQTAVGRLPVITARHRTDFETLVRALTRRNDPQPIPPSMGACIVSGYNNWDRIARLRREWEARAVSPDDDSTWQSAFASIQKDRSRYQDRFVLLCTGPYSAIDAASLGLADADWLALSARIRCEHECAHYVTRRVFGQMQAPLLDEVAADYCALASTTGTFPAHWFLRALGLEEPGHCRSGGRLQNYRGEPPLSDAAFTLMQAVVRAAADSLVSADAARRDRSPAATASLLVAITCLGLELLSVADGASRVLALHDAIRPHWPVHSKPPPSVD